jgi:hypothetical protein
VISGDYRELEHQRYGPRSIAALRLGDFPRVRQLLKASQTTLILDEACGARTKTVRVAPTRLMAMGLRAALRWDAN